MRTERETTALCANEGCGRPAPDGEPLCETCEIEWALYRREDRSAFAKASAEESAFAEAAGDGPTFRRRKGPLVVG